jgi:hypothetical protein
MLDVLTSRVSEIVTRKVKLVGLTEIMFDRYPRSCGALILDEPRQIWPFTRWFSQGMNATQGDARLRGQDGGRRLRSPSMGSARRKAAVQASGRSRLHLSGRARNTDLSGASIGQR